MIILKSLKKFELLFCSLILLLFTTGCATELIDAVESHNLYKVDALLKRGANINEQDVRGRTALIIAVTENNIEMVKLLLENNPDLNIQYILDHTALMHAVLYNYIEIVKLLLEHKPNLTIQDYKGQTALMIAARGNKKEIVDLLYSDSHVKSPQKSCFLTFVQEDKNKEIADGLLNAISTNVLAISSSALLWQLFSLPFIIEYFATGKFTVLTNETVDLVVIIPESLTNLGITIPEQLKQKDVISESLLKDVVRIERKYGFKNLDLINPPFVTQLIKTFGAKKDRTSRLIEHFMAIIDTTNRNHPTRFYLDGHGGRGTSIASIPSNYFNNFLDTLSAINTEFLYITSCYTGGLNLLIMQFDLEEIIKNQIAQQPQRIQEYNAKLKEYEQLMKKRMEAEPQKYGTDIDTYRKLHPEPIMPFIGIDYAIVIQATSGIATRTGGNINAMFMTLDEFLKNPSWALEFGPGVEKPQIEVGPGVKKTLPTITDVIASLGLKFSDSLPSIRLPGKTGFFRSINIGNMEIITASRLIEAGVERTLALIAESKSSDKSKADEAKRKLKKPLGIELPIKPDIRFIQIFPIDLTDFIFDIQGTLVPKFISKLTDIGQHFIGGITAKLPLGIIINRGFVNIFSTAATAESERCWFIKSVNLATIHIKKLVIKLDPAPDVEKKAYVGSYAYINENGEYIISKAGEPESKIDKEAYESTIRSWFESTIPLQETLTEATGGIEVTEEEKARLEKEKGGAEALRLIEPRFARTPQDLFNMFMAE